MSRAEKQAKKNEIKKVLKERLNIDCLRMLAEDGKDKKPFSITAVP